jgi:hypothetical protein
MLDINSITSEVSQYGWRAELTGKQALLFNRNGKHVCNVTAKNKRLRVEHLDSKLIASGPTTSVISAVLKEYYYCSKVN